MKKKLYTPSGFFEIINLFGLPPNDQLERKEWEDKNLTYISLPEPIVASWNSKFVVKRLRIHKKLEDITNLIFTTLHKKLWKYVYDFGGAYEYRLKRNDLGLSTHAWGIAIDLNCKDNPYRQKPNMNKGIVDLFEKNGWVWGGRWDTPDGMHFQFCKDY